MKDLKNESEVIIKERQQFKMESTGLEPCAMADFIEEIETSTENLIVIACKLHMGYLSRLDKFGKGLKYGDRIELYCYYFYNKKEEEQTSKAVYELAR